MSVPPDFTILNITGKFAMNKSLTNMNDTDTILSLQGVGWLKRQAIRYGTITLTINHYKSEDNEEKIDIDQTFAGSFPGTSENRTLVWKEKENEDHVFGSVIAKSRRVKPEELAELPEYLKTGWTEDTMEHGLVQAYAESNTPKSGTTWIGNQAWGVEIVEGERRYARHVDFTGPGGEHIQTKLFYDYLGPLDPR